VLHSRRILIQPSDDSAIVDAGSAREYGTSRSYVAKLFGDPKALAKWRGKKIAGVQLITDVKVLADQADKGLLPYALYRSLSGGTV